MDRAAFDRFADEYRAQLEAAVGWSGERQEYFHEYKAVLAGKLAAARGIGVTRVLDFGAGVGNSLPYLCGCFPAAALSCADPSPRSLSVIEDRFPGTAQLLRIEGGRIPMKDGAIDLAFSACVFHHIPASEHQDWLVELRRVCRRGGMLCIFEHNPWNPLTRKVVRDCPFDEDAVLISAPALCRTIRSAGWRHVRTRYTLFFPRFLSAFRHMERCLAALPIGAQYAVYAIA
jgi:SAM-dependent methyltransferase